MKRRGPQSIPSISNVEEKLLLQTKKKLHKAHYYPFMYVCMYRSTHLLPYLQTYFIYIFLISKVNNIERSNGSSAPSVPFIFHGTWFRIDGISSSVMLTRDPLLIAKQTAKLESKQLKKIFFCAAKIHTFPKFPNSLGKVCRTQIREQGFLGKVTVMIIAASPFLCSNLTPDKLSPWMIKFSVSLSSVYSCIISFQ